MVVNLNCCIVSSSHWSKKLILRVEFVCACIPNMPQKFKTTTAPHGLPTETKRNMNKSDGIQLVCRMSGMNSQVFHSSIFVFPIDLIVSTVYSILFPFVANISEFWHIQGDSTTEEKNKVNSTIFNVIARISLDLHRQPNSLLSRTEFRMLPKFRGFFPAEDRVYESNAFHSSSNDFLFALLPQINESFAKKASFFCWKHSRISRTKSQCSEFSGLSKATIHTALNKSEWKKSLKIS